MAMSPTCVIPQPIPGAPEHSSGYSVSQRDLCDVIDRGDLEKVRALLNRGADPNRQCGRLWPLAHAAWNSDDRADIVELLLQHGADPTIRHETIRTDFEETPLDIARRLGHHRVQAVLENHLRVRS